MTLIKVDPNLDDILGVLNSCSRREILYQLEHAETDVMRFEELVDAELAGNPEATDRAAVIADLYHTQLPRLAEIDWIDYDARSGIVRYRPENAPTAMLTAIRSKEASP